MANPPTLGQDLLEIVEDGRSILGPRDLDLRPTAVAIITRTWAGGVRGRDLPSDSVLALPDFTKARHVSQREIAGSGGAYEQGDVIIGPVTPVFIDSQGVTRGFTESQLAPLVQGEGVEVIYSLTSQDAGSGIVGQYTRKELRRDKRLRFMLVVGRDRTTPGP